MSFHFEFSDVLEEILFRHDIRNFVRYPRAQGRDRDGMHVGSRVHPGLLTVVEAEVEDEKLDPLLEDIERFRNEKEAHRHLRAMVIAVERTL